MLDRAGKGSINKDDIIWGLNYSLNYTINNSELAAFMKRFDKDQDSHLKYSEFCEAFLPVDSYHASYLAKKTP